MNTMTANQKFLTEISQFKDSVYSVRNNFIDIQKRKLEVLNEISGKMVHQEDIKILLKELVDINKLEERYFNIINKKFQDFHINVNEMKNGIQTKNTYSLEEKELISLSKQYWEVLVEVCDSLEIIFTHARERILNEKQHINNAKGGLFTVDKRKNFIMEYEKYLDSFKEQSSIENVAKGLDKKKALIENIYRRIDSVYNKLKARNELTDICIIGGTVAASERILFHGEFFEGLLSFCVMGLFYSVTMMQARNRLKNIVGKYNYTV